MFLWKPYKGQQVSCKLSLQIVVMNNNTTSWLHLQHPSPFKNKLCLWTGLKEVEGVCSSSHQHGWQSSRKAEAWERTCYHHHHHHHHCVSRCSVTHRRRRDQLLLHLRMISKTLNEMSCLWILEHVSIRINFFQIQVFFLLQHQEWI